MNLGCAVCDWFDRSHCLRQISGASARACVFFHKNSQKKHGKVENAGKELEFLLKGLEFLTLVI